jgi:CRISPR-associated exonuclease Cas4
MTAIGEQPPTTSTADSEITVPLSALEHYAYCHRQMALIHLDQIWTHSTDTLRGDLSHHAVDLPGLRRRAGVTQVRSLPVWSDEHHLYGICDMVEFHGDTAAPIEYKVGRYTPGGPADLQAAGQALCLIEAGFTAPTAYVYAVAERRRHPITIDTELLQQVIHSAAAIRRILHDQTLPTARNDTQCRRCSLRDDCLPDLTANRAAQPDDLFTPRSLGRWND